ncbi:DNA polymerase III subunit chi [Acinetobacter sp. NCu2D-2]|uniref:DNA polymerase III subunit chi n=1 Tax=Acinetobacter sp. NCu2D-2 TaxID=1608473 RepID=UPI0007CE0016|nr:DNA polymerase III subunit chi [Acinetobacter sp. NCu2D-2]ANF82776.1 DNA polymerase III subunit chi [Acinetobacter sp. NCu2D-2]
MAKVSFYLFEKSPERQVESACRLSRKILRQHARIWILCDDADVRQELDERLWTFDPTSFLAHGIDQPEASICISADQPEQNDWIIFNFNSEALEPEPKFSHIIEIIENNESAKKIGRQKFKQYRSYGIEPQTHKL